MLDEKIEYFLWGWVIGVSMATVCGFLTSLFAILVMVSWLFLLYIAVALELNSKAIKIHEKNWGEKCGFWWPCLIWFLPTKWVIRVLFFVYPKKKEQ